MCVVCCYRWYRMKTGCCVITSSLWASSRQRSRRAAKPVSSMLKPGKPVSSSLPPRAVAAAWPAGSELTAAESEPLPPAEFDRSKSRAWQRRDRWRSNRGRSRTAPWHDLQRKWDKWSWPNQIINHPRSGSAIPKLFKHNVIVIPLLLKPQCKLYDRCIL